MKILLVEDARSVVQVMTARLGSYGHEVIHADNGSVALEKFRASAPDLVLMDIEMPVMNGFEAASRIRATEATQQWAWTPIIFLTSSDTTDNLITAIEAGGDDFMAKSVPEPVLKAKMKAMGRIAALRQGLTVANRRLQELASRDGLTGLLNRRSMDTQTDVEWAACLVAGQPFGLLMVDIDNFKRYNDHYGHAAGDDCLREVAALIDQVLAEQSSAGGPATAFAARYGGEEFAVVLPACSRSHMDQLAHSLLDRLTQLKLPHDKNPPLNIVTLSVGGAHLERAQGEVQLLFRNADERLYQAKSQGRNRAVLGGFSP